MPRPWSERTGRPIGEWWAPRCRAVSRPVCLARSLRGKPRRWKILLEEQAPRLRPDREYMHRGRTPGADTRTPGTAAELECRVAASPEPEHGRFRTTELETLSDHRRSQPGPICRQSVHLANGELEVSAAAEAAARQAAPGVREGPAGMPPRQARLEDSRESSRSGSFPGGVPAPRTTF